MTVIRNSLNKVTYFVKKVKGVRKVGMTKGLAKKPKSSGNFSGSYSHRLAKSAITARQYSQSCLLLPVHISQGLHNR